MFNINLFCSNALQSEVLFASWQPMSWHLANAHAASGLFYKITWSIARFARGAWSNRSDNSHLFHFTFSLQDPSSQAMMVPYRFCKKQWFAHRLAAFNSNLKRLWLHTIAFSITCRPNKLDMYHLRGKLSKHQYSGICEGLDWAFLATLPVTRRNPEMPTVTWAKTRTRLLVRRDRIRIGSVSLLSNVLSKHGSELRLWCDSYVM